MLLNSLHHIVFQVYYDVCVFLFSLKFASSIIVLVGINYFFPMCLRCYFYLSWHVLVPKVFLRRYLGS
jgi:hypothetical protein